MIDERVVDGHRLMVQTGSCGHVGWTRLKDILFKPLVES